MPLPDQPFRPLLSEALNTGERRLSGTVRSTEELLKRETLEALDRQHRGSYVVFVHQPEIDTAVDSYLRGQALANDTGPGILALFAPKVPAAKTTAIAVPGLAKLEAANALIDFARALFSEPHLEIPGMLSVLRISDVSEPIYVPLKGLATTEKVADRVREVLALVSQSAHQRASANEFSDALSKSLAVRGIPYVRANGKKVFEYFLTALNLIWTAKEDLVVLVKAGAKMVGG